MIWVTAICTQAGLQAALDTEALYSWDAVVVDAQACDVDLSGALNMRSDVMLLGGTYRPAPEFSADCDGHACLFRAYETTRALLRGMTLERGDYEGVLTGIRLWGEGSGQFTVEDLTSWYVETPFAFGLGYGREVTSDVVVEDSTFFHSGRVPGAVDEHGCPPIPEWGTGVGKGVSVHDTAENFVLRGITTICATGNGLDVHGMDGIVEGYRSIHDARVKAHGARNLIIRDSFFAPIGYPPYDAPDARATAIALLTEDTYGNPVDGVTIEDNVFLLPGPWDLAMQSIGGHNVTWGANTYVGRRLAGDAGAILVDNRTDWSDWTIACSSYEAQRCAQPGGMLYVGHYPDFSFTVETP